jgi:hypothetical protein
MCLEHGGVTVTRRLPRMRLLSKKETMLNESGFSGARAERRKQMKQMKLNENLRICLLALTSRYPNSTMDINEEVIGPQCLETKECTPSGLMKLLQSHAPHLLDAPACLVVDAQERVIYLVEQSEQMPAFWIHCREHTQEEEIATLRMENVAPQAENRKLKTQLTQVLSV